MTNYSFNQVVADDYKNLSVVVDGDLLVADTRSHPNYEDILAAVVRGDEDIRDLFDFGHAIQRRFERLSERVTVQGDELLLDGDPMRGALADAVLAQFKDGEDFSALVNFLELLEANPNEHSREQAWDWIDKYKLTVTPRGHIVAYKGVTTEGRDGYEYTSISRGTAIVDGVEYKGAIPNDIGAVVEMPRSEVEHNPAVGCHVGLHAGTWDYASRFARGAVLTVTINPRDIVSVPTDCDWAKMRVCRYTVTDVTEQEHSESVYRGYDGVYDYDDLGYDDEDDAELPDPVATPGDVVRIVESDNDNGHDLPVGRVGVVGDVDYDDYDEAWQYEVTVQGHGYSQILTEDDFVKAEGDFQAGDRVVWKDSGQDSQVYLVESVNGSGKLLLRNEHSGFRYFGTYEPKNFAHKL